MGMALAISEQERTDAVFVMRTRSAAAGVGEMLAALIPALDAAEGAENIDSRVRSQLRGIVDRLLNLASLAESSMSNEIFG